MALANYTNISDAVADWLNRQGFTDVTDRVEDFIKMAHLRMIRNVRAPGMEKTAAVTITAGKGNLPADYLDAKGFLGTNAGGTKTWALKRSPYHIVKTLQETVTQEPKYFETNGTEIFVGGLPTTSTFELQYYADPGEISTSVATNWFSDNVPELYLYGALIEAAVFMKDTEQMLVYKKEFEEAAQRLKEYTMVTENSGNPLDARKDNNYLQPHINAESALLMQLAVKAMQKE